METYKFSLVHGNESIRFASTARMLRNLRPKKFIIFLKFHYFNKEASPPGKRMFQIIKKLSKW